MNAVSMKIAAAILGAAALQAAAASENLNANWAYVLDSQSDVVTSGYTGECVRTQWWTPALAAAHPQAKRCTPDLVPKPQPVAAPAAPAVPAQPPAQKETPKPQASKPEATRPAPQQINFSTDTLFDFDKADLKAEGKAKLDELPSMLQGANYDVIGAVGHTDRIGSTQYNQRLSEKRAQAVKRYLVDKGIASDRIRAEGKGESQPVTTPATCSGKRGSALIVCLQPDRRVTVEVSGTK